MLHLLWLRVGCSRGRCLWAVGDDLETREQATGVLQAASS